MRHKSLWMWRQRKSNGARFGQATAGMNDVQRPGPELEVSPVGLTIDSDASSVNVMHNNQMK